MTKNMAPAAVGEAEMEKNPLLRCKTYHFSDGVEDRTDVLLQQRGKTAKMKGFRPGKVPLTVLRRLYGGEMRNEVLRELALQKFYADVDAEKLRIAAEPAFEPSPVASSEGYQVECHFEILPEVAAANVSEQILKVPALPVGEAEVDEMIGILRRQHGDYSPVTGVAGDTHRITVEIQTTLADSDEEVEKSEVKIRMDADNLRSEVRDALRGAAVGETRQAQLRIDDTHPQEAARGKEVRMTLTIKAIEALHQPELADDFFTRFGVTEGGTEAFRNHVRTRLESEVGAHLRNLLRQRAMDALIEATPAFPLPRTLLYREAHQLTQNAKLHYQRHGLKKYADTLTVHGFVQAAERRVALGLILAQWRQRENPEFSDRDIERRLDELTRAEENPQRKKDEVRADPRQMEAVRLSLLEDQVADWVKQNATASEDKLSLRDLFAGDSSIDPNIPPLMAGTNDDRQAA